MEPFLDTRKLFIWPVFHIIGILEPCRYIPPGSWAQSLKGLKSEPSLDLMNPRAKCSEFRKSHIFETLGNRVMLSRNHCFFQMLLGAIRTDRFELAGLLTD